MASILKKLFLLIYVLLLCLSCSTTGPRYSHMKTEGRFSSSSGIIAYDDLAFRGEYYDTRFSFKYPSIKTILLDGSKSKNSSHYNNEGINKFILSLCLSYDDKKFGTVEDLRRTFFNDYTDFRTRNEIKIPWLFENEVSIQSASKNRVFVKNSKNQFLGGNHPITLINYYGYDLHNERALLLTDVITDLDKLNEIGEIYFRKEFSLPEKGSLIDADYHFPNNKFQLNNNFYITDCTIVFYFNPYEITSYVNHRDIDVVIPLSEIESILKQ